MSSLICTAGAEECSLKLLKAALGLRRRGSSGGNVYTHLDVTGESYSKL